MYYGVHAVNELTASNLSTYSISIHKKSRRLVKVQKRLNCIENLCLRFFLVGISLTANNWVKIRKAILFYFKKKVIWGLLPLTQLCLHIISLRLSSIVCQAFFTKFTFMQVNITLSQTNSFTATYLVWSCLELCDLVLSS